MSSLRVISSLRLTVVLFSMAMFLILAGTLAQTGEGVWTVVDRYFRSLFVVIPLQIFVPERVAKIPLALPFPGGTLLGGAIFVNLLAAHAVRFKLSWRRSGMILTHAGVLMLLVGEFVTGLGAREGNMSIDEGQSSSFVEDIRTAELAIIDQGDSSKDRVVVVPQKMLEAARDSGTPLAHAHLPVSLLVREWLPNSRLLGPMQATPQQRSRATLGMGTDIAAIAENAVTGVDGNTINVPSAYVTVIDAGKELGTFLLTVHLDRVQEFVAGGKTYQIALRFERTYKPYTIHLEDFRHDKFVGTDKPRNFSSKVRLIDAARNVDREVVISMNDPLRYAGDTIYQSAFKEGDAGTVLQVVRNPGWLLPYFSCAMVTLGLLGHFIQRLIPAAQRSTKGGGITRRAPEPPAPGITPGVQAALTTGTHAASRRGLLVSLAAVLFAVLAVASPFFRRAKATDTIDWHALGAIPVSDGGRTKPLDSFARSSLLVLSGKQTYASGDEGRGPNADAMRWYMEAVCRPKAAATQRVFRVDHPDLKNLLGVEDHTRLRFSWSEIATRFESLAEQIRRAREKPSRERDPFERAVIDLENKLVLFANISRLEAPYLVAPPPPSGAGAGVNTDERAPEWKPLSPFFPDSFSENTSARAWVEIFAAHAKGTPEGDTELNTHAAAYAKSFESALPVASRRARLETLFSKAQPFITAAALYLCAFLVWCMGLLLGVAPGASTQARPGKSTTARIIVALIVSAFVVHTVGILTRIYLQGRPPVTNLYSSAVFIGWACIPLAFAGDRLTRLGLGSAIASLLGFGTLLVAHHLSTSGDTMEMMQAVLDTNFWLATHVVVVTIGYSSTFLAGFLALAYILLNVFTRSLSRERSLSLSKMIYGVVCFASLTSFVGTVLGGIWADQSWGRFWGWDPKENGAALIVLWNLTILHARWGGLVKDRGVAVLAVGGNIVTAWSWFGTNMLGVGLHSYGFMQSAVFWLAAFMLAMLAVIALGLLPMRAWRSNRTPHAEPHGSTQSLGNA